MAAKIKKRRSKCPPFVFLNNKTLWNEEWLGLLTSRQVIYLNIKNKYNGINNGRIYLPYTEFQEQFRSKNTFYDSLDDLAKEGWINRKKKGGRQRFYYHYYLTGKYDDIDQPRKPFAGLARDLLNHPEWKKLSFKAQSHYLLIKCSYNGHNNGEIILPYSKLKRLCAPATSSKALNELKNNDWIEGVGSGGLFGSPACYKLTWRYDHWPKKKHQ
jgi:hypothetical protein